MVEPNPTNPHEEWLSDYMIALLLLQGTVLCFGEAGT